MRTQDLSCLESIDGLPAQVRRAVEEVCRRTGVRAKWNRLRETVHFYIQSPWFGVTEERVDCGWDTSVVDAICRHIRMGQRDRAIKDIELERAERAEADRKQQEIERYEEDVERDAMDLVRHDLTRASMGKHWKGHAVVSGLKE